MRGVIQNVDMEVLFGCNINLMVSSDKQGKAVIITTTIYIIINSIHSLLEQRTLCWQLNCLSV